MAAQDLDWRRLVRALQDFGRVEEVPGRLVVRQGEPDEGTGLVELVITPREWGTMVSNAGDVSVAVGEVIEALRDLAADQRFLVYDECELHPSSAPELPHVREREVFRAYFRKNRGRLRGNTAWYPGLGEDDTE